MLGRIFNMRSESDLLLSLGRPRSYTNSVVTVVLFIILNTPFACDVVVGNITFSVFDVLLIACRR